MLTNTELEAEARTILVVDDDLSVLTVIKVMLESSSYNILLAHSAESALHFVERDDLAIDLMLTDVMMPEMSGPELAEKVLALRPNIKILFMSGFTDSDVVRVKILDRALGFLPKPFTSDGLVERIESSLNIRRTAAQKTLAAWPGLP